MALMALAGFLSTVEVRDLPPGPTCSSCRATDPVVDEAGVCCRFHRTPGERRRSYLRQVTQASRLRGIADALGFNEYVLLCAHGAWVHPTSQTPASELARAVERGALFQIHGSDGAESAGDGADAGALAVARAIRASEEAAVIATRLAYAVGPRYDGSYLADVGDWLGASLTTSFVDKLVTSEPRHETSNLRRQSSGGFVSFQILVLSRCSASRALVQALKETDLGDDRARRLMIELVTVDEAANLQRAAGMTTWPFPALYESQLEATAKGALAFEVLQILLPFLKTGAWSQPRGPLEIHMVPDRACALSR